MFEKEKALVRAIEIVKEYARSGVQFNLPSALEGLYEKIVELQEKTLK